MSLKFSLWMVSARQWLGRHSQTIRPLATTVSDVGPLLKALGTSLRSFRDFWQTPHMITRRAATLRKSWDHGKGEAGMASN